jgi:hypothetical protein
MAGELLDIGRRPKLVASFAGRGASGRFQAWQRANAETLARVPLEALRVEYGRAGSDRWIRVRIDERHLPDGLEGPNEAGAADGLPPGPAAA